jgi:phosphoglycerate dehydrogenase-like enzyme
MKIWVPHGRGQGMLRDVAPGATIEVCRSVATLPSDLAGVEFLVPPMTAGPESEFTALARDMPDLRVVQLLTAGADTWVGRISEQVVLCDARGVHDSATAEWVVAAILTYLRQFPSFVRAQARGEWLPHRSDELAGKRVLLVGAGSIGAAVARRLAPFEVTITLVARRAREGVHPVETLPALLPGADIVVLLVPLTAATTGMINSACLAALPDGALLVNASRGPVVDAMALTSELTSGRIGAALDVTDPEPLPADHPLWAMPNVLVTPHVAGNVPGWVPRAYQLVADQVRRYAAGEPLANLVMDEY